MTQSGETSGDAIHLRKDILFVAACTGGHLSMDDGDFHGWFLMRFRAECMIPSIRSR